MCVCLCVYVVQEPTEWQIGSHCRAVYSNDGQMYDAVIVSLDADTGTCTVRYDYYNNKEVQRLDDLMPSTSRQHTYNNCSRSHVRWHLIVSVHVTVTVNETLSTRRLRVYHRVSPYPVGQ